MDSAGFQTQKTFCELDRTRGPVFGRIYIKSLKNYKQGLALNRKPFFCCICYAARMVRTLKAVRVFIAFKKRKYFCKKFLQSRVQQGLQSFFASKSTTNWYGDFWSPFG
jgi:hypothetical protein